jgi:hypothetical protein
MNMRNFIILLFMSCAVAAFGQGTAKDTVTVLTDAEVTTGTLNDTLKMYYIQGGTWKKSALSAFRTFYTPAKDTFAMVIAMSDETTDLTTGAAKVTFRAPFAMTITGVRANVNTAPVGSTIIVDINEAGSTIMATNKLSIDATEETSVTAATAAGITDSSIADDAEITLDIDQIGSSTAGKGLKVTIYYIKA